MKKIIIVASFFVFALAEIWGLSIAKTAFFRAKAKESAENLYGIIVNQSAELRSGNIDSVLASESNLKDEISKFKKYSDNKELVLKLENYQSFILSARAEDAAKLNRLTKELNQTLTSDEGFKNQYESVADLAGALSFSSDIDFEKDYKENIKSLANVMKRANRCKNRCSAEEYTKIQQEYNNTKERLLELTSKMNDNILRDVQTNLLIEELKKVEEQ